MKKILTLILAAVLAMGSLPLLTFADEDGATLRIDGSGLVEGWESLFEYVPDVDFHWEYNNLGEALSNFDWNGIGENSAIVPDGYSSFYNVWTNNNGGLYYYNLSGNTISGINLGYLAENAKNELSGRLGNAYNDPGCDWAFSEGSWSCIENFKFFISVDGKMYDSSTCDDMSAIEVKPNSDIVIYLTANPVIITSIDGGEATVKMAENISHEDSYIFHAAAYSESGVLKSATTEKFYYNSGNTENFSLPDYENGDIIKIFIWNENLKPAGFKYEKVMQ